MQFIYYCTGCAAFAYKILANITSEHVHNKTSTVPSLFHAVSKTTKRMSHRNYDFPAGPDSTKTQVKQTQ